mgnify:CR=1 FL=1
MKTKAITKRTIAIVLTAICLCGLVLGIVNSSRAADQNITFSVLSSISLTISGDVSFGSVDPVSMPQTHNTTTAQIKSNKSYSLTAVAGDDLKSNNGAGPETIEIGKLSLKCTDGNPCDLSSYTAMVKTGSLSLEDNGAKTNSRYFGLDYQLNIDYLVDPASNYKTVITYTATQL